MFQKRALEPVDQLGPRFYGQLFLVEKVTGLATCHRPVDCEWLCHGDEVSDGDLGVSVRVDQERGLDVLDRPEGRLLPDSCPSGISAVSSLLSRGTGLSVPCALLQFVHSPAGVHQSLRSGFGVCALEGCVSTPLTGRLAGHCSKINFRNFLLTGHIYQLFWG